MAERSIPCHNHCGEPALKEKKGAYLFMFVWLTKAFTNSTEINIEDYESLLQDNRYRRNSFETQEQVFCLLF